MMLIPPAEQIDPSRFSRYKRPDYGVHELPPKTGEEKVQEIIAALRRLGIGELGATPGYSPQEGPGFTF